MLVSRLLVQHKVGFLDVAIIALRSGYLDDESVSIMSDTDPRFHPERHQFLPTWIARPNPLVHLQKFYGFGRPSIGRSTSHDKPNPVMMVHFAWSFLTTAEQVCCTAVNTSWKNYAALRADAVTQSLAPLHVPRLKMDDKDFPTSLCPETATTHSLALLRFDFRHGDLVRWLGGEYTNEHRKFDEEWVEILEILDKVLPPDELPPVNPVQAFSAQTTGVPLKADYITPHDIPAIRDDYDNHPAVAENTDAVMKKFAKEEWKRYHIHYDRWLFPFLHGLIINPIQWVWQKGKGRICIDCTNGPPDKRGSVNTYIPKPWNAKKPPKNMKLDVDECPPTYFKYAFKRVIRRILRMRMTCPAKPILVHADDIDAAFRRVLYHPDLAVAFAYFFDDFLIVPISQVFGGRSSPPCYGLLADVRELLAAVQPMAAPEHFHPLVKESKVSLIADTPLTKIPPDSHHPMLSKEELSKPFQASYVDDMATVAFPEIMASAVDNSVKAAFRVFGAGNTDRRGDCLQMDKWDPNLSERCRFLGFDLDTNAMTITWPRDKRERLNAEISEVLSRPLPRYVSPKEMAHLVGTVRSASEIAPWGTFLSFNLQNALTSAARRARDPNKSWYSQSRIWLSKTATATLHQLQETLLCDDGLTWTRPMALYFDRDYTHRVYSDASYIGIGGWSADFDFIWRVTSEELDRLDFDMKKVDPATSEPLGEAQGLHINPLEYVAALINLWLSLTRIIDAGPRDGGYVLQLNSDNTTALAWMSEAARTPDPFLQGLARLGSGLLVAAARLLTKVVPTHIPGKENTEADVLSRPAAASHLRSHFIAKDRGVVRRSNDRTFDSQAKEFVGWCSAMGFQEHHILGLSDLQCIDVLGTYVGQVADGYNIKKKLDLTAQSLGNYVRAAHGVLELWLDRDVYIFDKHSMGEKKRFHRYIGQQIADRRTWSRKKPRKLALTRDIYVALAKYIASLGTSLEAFFGAHAAVYDWLRLGAFTGFRPSEFAQTKVRKGEQFLSIPDSSDVPEDQRGKPVAFVASDFTFYTADLREIPHRKLMRLHRRGLVRYVQLCWRFDKSAHNFVVRRFQTTGDSIFDPVGAAVSIIYRAQLLEVPPDEPIGVWRSPTGRSYRFIRDSKITEIMRAAVVLAYPDPNHYYRRNIKSVVPHCIRVFAAVLMKLGGAVNDEIAQKIRWDPTSVPTYLRDGFDSAHVGQDFTMAGIAVSSRAYHGS